MTSLEEKITWHQRPKELNLSAKTKLENPVLKEKLVSAAMALQRLLRNFSATNSLYLSRPSHKSLQDTACGLFLFELF